MNQLLLGRFGRGVLAGYGWLMALFLVLPAVILIPISFSAETAFVFPPAELSLRWYERLIAQPRWRDAVWLSLQVAALSALLASVLGTMAAIAIARLAPAAARGLKLLFVAPMIVPLMVAGVGFYVVFSRLGILGSLFSLVLAHTVLVLPFVVLPVTARLTQIDPALERAAAASGAGAWRTLLRVTLPLVAPAVLAGFAFAFIFSFDEVVVAQFLTGPRLETLPRRMWEGIAIGGLDNTITAVTTVQIAVAVLAMAALPLWRQKPRPPVAEPPAARNAPAPAGPGAAKGVAIAFEGLGKRYGAVAAVEDVRFDVEPGEFVTLLGPSGSGKTTLLMLVAGFEAADSGRLLMAGSDVTGVPPHRRDLGVVFQHYALFPHLDVSANVAFPLEARGLGRAAIRERVGASLDLVQLNGYGSRRVAELSGGQQQRVALARALVFGPRALLMDEPLAALDRSLRLEMQGELRRLQRRLGQTVLYVTHDQEEALNLSDRIVVMRSARVQQIGTPQELYRRPANSFVAAFFGEANLIRGTAAEGVLEAGGFRLPMSAGWNGPAVLCVRPEQLRFGGSFDDGSPALPGRLVEVRFQGSVLRLEIETPVGPFTVTRQSGAGIPEIGAAVALSWDASQAREMPS